MEFHVRWPKRWRQRAYLSSDRWTRAQAGSLGEDSMGRLTPGQFPGRALNLGVILGATLLATGAAAGQATLVADTHVNAALPAMNSGTISNVNVGGGYTGLLQFDLSLLPSGTTSVQISRAVLRVYVNRMDTPGLVSLTPITSGWSEYGVTYQMVPSLGAVAHVFTISQAGAYVAVDVTSLVRSWVAAPATNFGVALTAGTAVLQLDSKENDLTSHAATLDVMLVAQGPAGATGATGAMGPTGPVGPQGAAGMIGSIGPQGPAGPNGVAGTAGPAGITGPGGPAGPQGIPGLAGASGATGASGSPGLVYQGAYAATTNYALGDVVVWAGSSYASLTAGNHGNTPAFSPAQWGLLTAQGPPGPTGATGAAGQTGAIGALGPVGPPGQTGPQGTPGTSGSPGPPGMSGATGAQGLSGPAGPQGVAGPVGLSFKGQYSSGANYALADGVSWQGAGYVSLVAANHGNTPDQSPALWALFAAAGAPGATGVAGPQGATGPAGPQGVVGATGTAGVQGPVGPQGPAVVNYLGNYASGTNYGAADAVSFGGSTYVSLVAANHGNTPGISPTYWAVLAAQGVAGAAGPQGLQGLAGTAGVAGVAGPAGPQGPPVAFAGGWLIGTAYAVGTAVSYGGSSYVAITANTGRQPDVSPIYWGVLAQAGVPGPTGAIGAQGPAGYPGATGPVGAMGPSGPTGAAGVAATVQIGTVATGSAGSSAIVTNSGTGSAAVLNFVIPQGATGAGGSGGGGTGSNASMAMYHAVSYANTYYSVSNTNQGAAETTSVLTWVPTGCSATSLAVYSQQAATITVTLRTGVPGTMADSALSCPVANGQSCTATGSVAVPAGGFMDIGIYHPDSVPSGVWVAITCI